LKIRIDFVTNSSSASFVLTAREEVLDIKINNFTKMGKPGVVQLLTFIKDKLKKEGNQVRIGGEDYCFTVKEFELGKNLILNGEVDPEAVSGADFSLFSDDEMWDLINWIAVRGKSEDLYGVGATQITDITGCTCGHIPGDIQEE
jgi:hypothetical protein